MNLSDATAIYIGDQAASAVYITDAAGTPTKVWPTAAPAYPASGEWGPAEYNFSAKASHTIAEDGTFTITHTATRVGGGSCQGAVKGPWGQTNGPFTGTSTATWTGALTAGTLIEFIAGAISGQIAGTWTITKN